jgi:hypothetical protein
MEAKRRCEMDGRHNDCDKIQRGIDAIGAAAEDAISLSQAIAVDLSLRGPRLFLALAPESTGVEGRAIRARDAFDDVSIDRQRAGMDEGAIECEAGSRTGVGSPSDTIVIHMPSGHVGRLFSASRQTG